MKTLKFIILLSVISFWGHAQRPYLGAKYALSFTKLSNQHITNNVDSMKSNYFTFSHTYGIIGGFTFTDRFALQAELLYNSISQSYEGGVKLPNYTSLTEIKTLDIPILAVVGKWVYVEAGPVFNILLKANFTSSVDSLNNKDVTKNFDATNVGIAIGGGICLHAGPFFAVNLGLRTYIGLKDFGNGVDALGKKITDYKTNGWSLGLNGGLRIIF